MNIKSTMALFALLLMALPARAAWQIPGDDAVKPDVASVYNECYALINSERSFQDSVRLRALIDSCGELSRYAKKHSPDSAKETLLMRSAHIGDEEAIKMLLSQCSGYHRVPGEHSPLELAQQSYAYTLGLLSACNSEQGQFKKAAERRYAKRRLRELEERRLSKERIIEWFTQADQGCVSDGGDEGDEEDGENYFSDEGDEGQGDGIGAQLLHFNCDQEVDEFMQHKLQPFLQEHKDLLDKPIVHVFCGSSGHEFYRTTLLDYMARASYLDHFKTLLNCGASVFAPNGLGESVARLVPVYLKDTIEMTNELANALRSCDNDQKEEHRRRFAEHCEYQLNLTKIKNLVTQAEDRVARAKDRANMQVVQAAIDRIQSLGAVSKPKLSVPAETKNSALEPKTPIVCDGGDCASQDQSVLRSKPSKPVVAAPVPVRTDERKNEDQAAKRQAAERKAAERKAEDEIRLEKQKQENALFARACAKFKNDPDALGADELRILQERYHCSSKAEEIKMQKLVGNYCRPVHQEKTRALPQAFSRVVKVAHAQQQQRNNHASSGRSKSSPTGQKAKQEPAVREVPVAIGRPQPFFPAGSSVRADDAERGAAQKIEQRLASMPDADDFYSPDVALFKARMGFVENDNIEGLAAQLKADSIKQTQKQLHPSIKELLAKRMDQLKLEHAHAKAANS